MIRTCVRDELEGAAILPAVRGWDMVWNNNVLMLYHGTDNYSVASTDHRDARGDPTELRLTPNPNNIYIGPNVDFGAQNVRSGTEFGPGFYTTTSAHQARQWANQRVRRINAPRQPPEIAVLLRFQIDREAFQQLKPEMISFVRDDPVFWDFVVYARKHGRRSHLRPADPNRVHFPEMYEVVHGPVTIWQQTLVIKDCDQVSFHSLRAVGALGTADWIDQGNPLFPSF